MLRVLSTGFSLGVDGPGLRLVVYLKGCNLQCPWCAAPESWRPEPEVLFYPDRADDPASVPSMCPYGAVVFDVLVLTRSIDVCLSCVGRECLDSGHPSFELVGSTMSIAELVALADRYRPFIGLSGGVTIGGGEPTLQFHELLSLLVSLKSAGFHTAVETNGTHPDLPSLFELIDLLYIDLKHPDPSVYDGSGVLSNIRSRFESGREMIVRIPLVGGFNADAPFGPVLASIGAIKVEVLPYHQRGNAKWLACGRALPDASLRAPSDACVQGVKAELLSFGLEVI